MSTLHGTKLIEAPPVRRGGYILWDENARAVLFKKDDRDCTSIRRGTDNKWVAAFIKDENDFLEFSLLMANMFGYGTEKVENLSLPAFHFI